VNSDQWFLWNGWRDIICRYHCAATILWVGTIVHG